MENLSSADLDASSKTPLFIGIAAVIIAGVGVWLGWLGFSKASELESRMAEISGTTESIGKMESTLNSNSEMIRKAAGKISGIESNLAEVTSQIENDISGVKRSMRTLAMQAGTALKKVELLEKSGVRSASAPAPTPKPKEEPVADSSGKGGSPTFTSTITHSIASGDTYEKLKAKYKVSVNDLLDANPGVDPRRLRIGQKIIIPVAE